MRKKRGATGAFWAVAGSVKGWVACGGGCCQAAGWRLGCGMREGGQGRRECEGEGITVLLEGKREGEGEAVPCGYLMNQREVIFILIP